MMIWVWGIVTAVALILEFVGAGLFTIWFAAGAFVALLIEIIFPNCPIIVECVIFVLVSVALLIATRAISKKLTKGKEIKTNLDAYMGKIYKVNRIAENGYAYIMIGDIEWRVLEIEEKPLELNDMIEIVKIEGIKLAVKKVEKNKIEPKETAQKATSKKVSKSAKEKVDVETDAKEEKKIKNKKGEN